MCFLFLLLCLACIPKLALAVETTSNPIGTSRHQKTLDEIFGSTSKPKSEKEGSALEEFLFKLKFPKAAWIQDPQSGCRILNKKPEEAEAIKYTGVCKDGYANGNGKVEWFKNGKPNGVTTGDWLNGLPNGHVVHEGVDSSFEGDYVDGKINGSGKVTLKDGSIYVGQFKSDQRSGRGLLITADKVRLEGEFFKNEFMGYVPPSKIDESKTISDGFLNFVSFKSIQLLKNYKIRFEKVGLELSVLALILGLTLGGLLSNLINRIPMIESIKGRGETPKFGYYKPFSYCSSCGNTLGWKNVVPIGSYVFQKGRCHSCREKIGRRYLVIEISTAALLFFAILTWDKFDEIFVYFSGFLILMCSAFIGAANTKASKQLSLALVVVGLLASAFKIPSLSPEDAIIGGALGFAFPWLYNIIYKKQHWNVDLIDESNFLLMAGIGIWIGPIAATVVFAIGYFVQGVISTIYANNEYKVHEYQNPIICALAIFTLLMRQ